MELKVNGRSHRVEVDPETPLLWVLREHLGLTGAKYSCGQGECGACTVLVDGVAVLSCVTEVSEVAGRSVTTIEDQADETLRRVKDAWLAEDVPQCGYCQPGQIMTAAALLKSNPKPSEKEIVESMSGVLCRCGSYLEIKDAVKRAAKGGES